MELQHFGVYHKRALRDHLQRADARNINAAPTVVMRRPLQSSVVSTPINRLEPGYSTPPPPIPLPTVATVSASLFTPSMLLTKVAAGAFACEIDSALLGDSRLYLTALVRPAVRGCADEELRKWAHELHLGAHVRARSLPWDELHLRSGTPRFSVTPCVNAFSAINLVDTASVPISRHTILPGYSEYVVVPKGTHALAAELERLGLRVRLYHKKVGHHTNAHEFAPTGTLASALNTKDTSLVF